MRRKFLSVVLCVCMMLTMAPFAFAAEKGDTSTESTQEQSNSSGSGSGSPTTSVTLPSGNSGNLTISTDNAVLDGSVDGSSNLTYTNGIITVNADNVTIKNLVFGDNAKLVVNTTGKFTLTGCTFAPTQVYNKATDTPVRTAVTLNVGEAVVTNNTFNGVASGYYNAIEFGIGASNNDLSKATITGNTFNSAIQNNYFNFYNMTEGATIDIESNHFLLANKGSNAIRISNFRNVSGVTFNVNNNEYTYANDSDESQYEGFILLEDYSPEGGTVQDFSGITININNLTSPSNAKQLFYVYDDQDHIIARNQPIVKGDSSIAKFFSARIGDTYYKTLAGAYAALPRNVGANSTPTTITVLKDSDGEAIGSDSDKDMNYVIDFNGHTYTVGKPTVGSTGTETQGLRVLKGSTAVFKNGTLKAANYQNMKMPVHTYGDVTFQDFTVDAREDSYASVAYEIDNGSLKMLGNSSILAYSGKTGLYVAFWPRGNYVDGTTVTINTTGKITGKLVYEWDDVADTSKQQTENKAVLKIENGNFAITGIETLFTNSISSNLKVPKIFISGGYFTIDPSTYVVEGKSALPGSYVIGDTTYNYKVDKDLPANVEVIPGKTEVDATNLSQDNASKIANSAISNVSEKANEVATSLSENEKATKEALNEKLPIGATQATDSNTITTVVSPRLNIAVTSYDPAAKTLTLDVKAVYDIKATTNPDRMVEFDGTNGASVNTVTLKKEAGTLDTTGTPVTLKFYLPDGIANEHDSLFVIHTKSTGEKYVHAVTVQKDDSGALGALYVEFVNDKGFSTFSISAVVAASITTNGDTTYYETLQDAVNAVQNNETITLLNDTKENVTVSKAIKFTLAGKEHLKGSIAAGSRYSMTTSETNGNTEYTFTYVGGGSSSSISTPTTYAVNINAATNGAVAADKKTASKGTTVTVTASPSKGYVVDAVKVVDKDGKDVAVTEKDGKYVFTMPASAVTVTGSFKAETPAPVALPFTDVKSGNWFYDAVKYAYAQGLMTGTSATTFAPNGTMNRAMIVTVLYRLEKSPAVTGASKFTDVPAGQWYSDAVAWAAANKIVNGYDETTFGPMNAVTREQMAAILFRYEQVKGLENVTLEENLNRFPDQNKISAYAIPALQWAVGQKIINGNADGTLDPTGTATRAQVAQIFTNLLNK